MTEPKRIQAYGDDARTLDLAQFKERHGSAFLVSTISEGLRAPRRPGPTIRIEDVANTELTASPSPLRPFLVFPVRHIRSPFPNRICVGRTSNNDIVIPDVSVSKVHAFIQHGEDGQYILSDAGSRNGTFVNERPVSQQKEGTPVVVAVGEHVRFGQTEFLFLDAARVRELAINMTQ